MNAQTEAWRPLLVVQILFWRLIAAAAARLARRRLLLARVVPHLPLLAAGAAAMAAGRLIGIVIR